MMRRAMIRRVERLETRIVLKQQRLQFIIHFVEPDGTIASTLMLGDQDDQQHGTRPERAAV
jgi:hypothetical protein